MTLRQLRRWLGSGRSLQRKSKEDLVSAIAERQERRVATSRPSRLNSHRPLSPNRRPGWCSSPGIPNGLMCSGKYPTVIAVAPKAKARVEPSFADVTIFKTVRLTHTHLCRSIATVPSGTCLFLCATAITASNPLARAATGSPWPSLGGSRSRLHPSDQILDQSFPSASKQQPLLPPRSLRRLSQATGSARAPLSECNHPLPQPPGWLRSTSRADSWPATNAV